MQTPTREYNAISAFYGDRTTKRSGVRLMNHIDEGLIVLDALKANNMTKRAFCIHPLLQTDGELNSVGRHHVRSPLSAAFPVMLAMEYRARANDFLSDRIGIGGRGRIYEPAKTPEENREGPWVQDPPYIISGQPHPGKMPEVKLMLIADKVQNYKDFQQYHINTHPRRVELTYYFNLWLDVLGVDSKRYGEFCEMMKACQAA